MQGNAQTAARPRLGGLSTWALADIARLGLALLVTQALFWVFVIGVVRLSPLNTANLEQFRVMNLSMAPAQGATQPFPAGPFQTAPNAQLFVPNPGLVQFSVIVKDPEQGLGIFIPRLADNVVVSVNGVRLAPPVGDWAPRPNRTGVVGLFYTIPANDLRAGANQIELFVVRACCKVYINSVFAGPLPQMQAIAAAAFWFRINLTWIIIATSTLIGLVAITLLSLKRGQAFLWSVIACSATVSLGTYFYIDTGTLITPEWRAWYGHILGALVGYLSFLSLVNAWTSGPTWLYKPIVGVALVSVVITGVAVPWQTHDQVLQLARIFLAIVMLAAISGVVILLYRYVQTREVGRYWQAGLLLISSGAAITDYILGLEARIQPIYFVPFSNLTLMTALGIALAQRGAQLYLDAEAANQTLEVRISAREKELEQSAEALLAQEAETAIQTERARIMRDMHDGMGGQLLTLLMQARDPSAKREELEETVETAIADLRLLIDSLDSVGDSLDIALAMFRERLGQRLSGARVELDWPYATTIIERKFTPGQILSIYRILQEAISNALRHGRPKTIVVTQEVNEEAITITLSDDGTGMSEAARAGRGLTNMRRRAAEIGGSLSVDQSPLGGVQITLSLPTR
jgi:two-component system, NarL family, sensor histidine kinase UhpB